MHGHTLQCNLEALERGLEQYREQQEWAKEGDRHPGITDGALLGTLEDRYERMEIHCVCEPDAAICQCCLLTAYGADETCYHFTPEDHPDGLCGDEPMTTVIATIGYAEPYFSWRWCDLCGSPTGGDRYDVVIDR